MKKCTKCNIKKSIDSFSIRTKAKDGRQSYCKTCAVEIRMKAYHENIEKESEYRKNIKKLNQHNIRSYKESNPCTDCNTHYPYYVMDFDHISNKKYNVSQMLTLSWDTILKEISKCEIVCANCHRKRTYKRMLP